MNAPNAASAEAAAPPRGRRVTREPSATQRFQLREGEAYRIAYTAGATAIRRVSRSVVIFDGVSERRRWDGHSTPCLDFTLPHGRPLSLLSAQLVDCRPATQNPQGQWVLLAPSSGNRRRHRRPARA
ncbi:MAG: hypothetical protein ACYDAC_07715 [Candidatus Dormibacteria bacterium]